MTRSLANGLVFLGQNDLASDTDNVWTDGAVDDAHVYAGWTYDYYFKRFGRNGLDNRNIPMVSLVHPVRRTDLAVGVPLSEGPSLLFRDARLRQLVPGYMWGLHCRFPRPAPACRWSIPRGRCSGSRSRPPGPPDA